MLDLGQFGIGNRAHRISESAVIQHRSTDLSETLLRGGGRPPVREGPLGTQVQHSVARPQRQDAACSDTPLLRSRLLDGLGVSVGDVTSLRQPKRLCGVGKATEEHQTAERLDKHPPDIG